MNFPKKLQLAFLPTPVQQVEYNGRKFLIKRDDLTEFTMSGNKIRKLEYLLAQAKRKRAQYVFTCGAEQSNHSRATAIAAAKVGLKSRLFLWGKDKIHPSGNLLLDKLVNAEFEFLNIKEYGNVARLMEKRKEEFDKKGKKAVVIPEGGSNAIGILGYVNFIKELNDYNQLGKAKGIITAAGSGGTAAGMLIGSALYNLNLKIFAVTVFYNKRMLEEKIFKILDDFEKYFNLRLHLNLNNLEIIEGYSREGYKNISEDKLRVVIDFYRQSGILFDPAYTGKAFFAFNDLFLSKKNSNVIFLHSGGTFGVFAKAREFLKVLK